MNQIAVSTVHPQNPNLTQRVVRRDENRPQPCIDRGRLNCACDLASWSNHSMDKVIDPSKCPICGESNQCAQEIAKATGKPPEKCWCMTATFSSELLDRVPDEAKNKACICSKCANSTAF